MLLKGTMEDLIYRNDENGYSVVVLEVDGLPVTCVGNLPVLSEGEIIECEGEYKENAKYGLQFVVSSANISAPESEEGLVRFLASGVIKGVGEVTAAAIVSKFKKDSIDIIEFNPSELTKIRGISSRKANEIHESFMNVRVMRKTLMLLQSFNISSGMSVKIYNIYGERTREIVENNPYKLIEDIDGIGFATADKIAGNLGIKPEDSFRLQAGVIHILKTAAEKNGHTYLPLEELNFEVTELLKIIRTDDELRLELNDMALNGKVKLVNENNLTLVMLMRFYVLEKAIAAKLSKLEESADTDKQEYAELISQYEAQYGIEFHESQRNAVINTANSGISVITGGPGTGKTTIIKCIINIMERLGHNLALLAPTGRAAKRMSEATDRPAKTIHRALQVEFGGKGGFVHNENNPLDATFVIIDEVSMVDVYLMTHLLKALRQGTRLLLVGDKDQLPSVGAGNVLGDILASGVVRVSELTQIYRQAEKSRIITNAHLINSGKMPVLINKEKDTDFFYSERNNPQAVLECALEMVTKRIPSFLNTEPVKIQVLSPLKNGAAGVKNLNKNLQKIINPFISDACEIISGEEILRLNDKVMHITNDYDLEWTKYNGVSVEEGAGVFNGDIGTIIDVQKQSGELTVEFEDGRTAAYNRENIEELTLAYAVTVHKSQGSEFDCVVLPLVNGSGLILTKNLLYTAVTRAKKMVMLIGSKAVIERMVENNYTRNRYSRLKNLLVEAWRDIGDFN